jgi:riboflavin kinase/FMN adenylyltransferase
MPVYMKKTVIALGFFDGVHRGHGELIKMARRRAEKSGAVPAVLSFDVNPESVITGAAVPLIGSTDTRAYMVRRFFGVEKIIIHHFDENIMAMQWRKFMDSLVEKYSAAHLVIGHDFRCGHKGEGTPARISEYCAETGIGCDIIPKYTLDGITVSSTYIRELITEGAIGRANHFLGHPFIYAGTVRNGYKIGRTLGRPTINLDGDDPNLLLPANGVYATKILLDDSEKAALTNV